MKQIILLMWINVVASEGFLSPEIEVEETSAENLILNSGYPKPGDIPILNRKVFKGQRITIREHPYVASVRRKCSHYVTGALLTKNIILTVAHALTNVPVIELAIVVGENYSDRGSMLHTVLFVIIHEEFDPFTLNSDIAMLRIYEEITYKGSVKSIALFPPTASLEGHKAFVTGWGRCDNMGNELCLDRSSKYYPNEKMDPMLRTVSFIMKFPNEYCDSYKRHEVTMFPGMLCTGVAREADPVCPCLGVPGALLVTDARLTGVLSWGFGCGYTFDIPLVYSNTQYFSSWILHNIKIMRIIKQNNLTEIFEATKAAILSEWLLETRVITPKKDIRIDKTLEPLNIDYILAKLRGSIYDVRDYVSGGTFYAEKKYLYENIRKDFQIEESQTIDNSTESIELAVPFIGNDTLIEIGFNTSDIGTVSSDLDKEESDTDDDFLEEALFYPPS